MDVTLQKDGSQRANIYAKICLACGEKFLPRNQKRKFCCAYCKHVYHYAKFKLEFKNEALLSKENLNNYKVLKKCDQQGIHTISPDGLELLGYNKSVIAPLSEYNGRKVAVYNCYGLYFENTMFHIIKLSQWKLNK
jgi:hypothetical protein